MELKIGIDSGLSLTKFAYELEEGEYLTNNFPTTLKKSSTDDGRFRVSYNGCDYVMGEPTEQLTKNSFETCKLNDLHKISAIVAISEIIKARGLHHVKNVKATINMPLTEFINVDKRKQVVAHYSEFVDVVVNKENYRFNLEVKPYFEGYGIAMKNFNRLGGINDVIVIDLGSLNVNVATYGEMKKPILDKSKCFKGGMNTLLLSIQQAIAKATTKEPSLSEVKKILKIKNGRKKGVTLEMQLIADNQIKIYLEALKTKLQLLGVDMDDCDVIIAGGGAVLLENYIHKYLGYDVIIDRDGENANAIGSMVAL